MVRLTFLGTARIERSDEVVAGPAAQRRRIALLALLAASPEPGVARDKLLAYLWPEADSARGRHLLSHSLYIIRRVIGADSVQSEGDVLRLNAERVQCDVADFTAAVGRSDAAAAAALYAGPFLDGFFLSGAPEFERWVDAVRDRLAGDYARSLESLAEEASARSDLAAAAQWWRRLAAHDPYSSRVAVRVMQSLAAAGDLAGGLRHALLHETLLRDDLGIEPDAQVRACADQLRAEGVRPAPPSEVPRSVPSPERSQRFSSSESSRPAGTVSSRTSSGTRPATTPSRAATGSSHAVHDAGSRSAEATRGEKPPRLRPRRWLPVLSGIALLFLMGALLQNRRAAIVFAKPEPPVIHSLAVLPFANCTPDPAHPDRADPGQEYFADGMTDALLTELTRIPDVRVISRTSAMRYRFACGSRERRERSLPRIARELGVEGIVEGTVVRIGERVRISAQLVHATTDTRLWADAYERPLHDLLLLQKEVAEEIRLGVHRNTARPDSSAPVKRLDADAHELYLRGRWAWNERSKEGLETALVHFRGAIDRDPTYAAAHAGLADTYVILGYLGYQPADIMFAKGKAAAHQALALDSTLAGAYAPLGQALLWERDWAGAERAFLRALELSPGYATSHQWYAAVLVLQGRIEEAVAHTRHAALLDPLSLQINNTHGMLLHYAGRSREALRHYQHVIDAEPDSQWVRQNPWLLSNASRVYTALGRFPEALRLLEHALSIVPRHPRVLWDLASTHVAMGHPEEALRTFARADSANGQYAYFRASVFAVLDEPDSAFHWLDRVREWSPSPVSELRMDPRLEPLRSDRRYGELLAQLGL